MVELRERERERERERGVMPSSCGGASDPCCCNGSCMVVTDLDGFFYGFLFFLWWLMGLRGVVGVAWVSCGV